MHRGPAIVGQPGRVGKVFSSRWNWDSPTPSPAGECVPPPFGPGGGAHSLTGEGVGGSQFRRGTYTVILYVYMYFVTNTVSPVRSCLII
jgi:hypothetical protein